MERAEWEAIEGSNCDMHALRIGGASAYATGPCRCGCGEGPRWDVGEDEGPASSFDQAKQIAEGKLREIRDALVEHFAPVLRWSGQRALLTLDSGARWSLYADSWNWGGSCSHPGRPSIAEFRGSLNLVGGPGGTEKTRKHAEAALRALGVVFRTEGE